MVSTRAGAECAGVVSMRTNVTGPPHLHEAPSPRTATGLRARRPRASAPAAGAVRSEVVPAAPALPRCAVHGDPRLRAGREHPTDLAPARRKLRGGGERRHERVILAAGEHPVQRIDA